MNKFTKLIKIVILASVVILIISLCFLYSKSIHFIKFDKLTKLKIAYIPDNSPFENYYVVEEIPEFKDILAFEIEVTDKEFLELIEKNYRNKFIKDTYGENDGNMRYKKQRKFCYYYR